ncbi:MAG: hypothetical protein IKP88_09005 [Lachnospiraceae bacterium]|jgi:hypothetical protein|nr:hypothetical protein [Lachnospiraceae bacterium]
MAAANDRQGCLLQNLQAAMCPEEMTRECIGLAETENEREMLRILEEHRKELLTRIHGYQKALDCLDYLVFQTKKHRKQEEL